jgi:hypothetical protein
MSEDTLKLIESDLQEIFSNLQKESGDEINEKNPDSEQVASYGKIQFSLDGLNLKADAKEKLLRKLYHYAGRKGLHEFKQSNSTGKE